MIAILAAILSIIGQTPGPGASGSPVALGEPYYDGSYGFSIRAPVGWQLSRQREFDERGTVILRMTDPGVAGDPPSITVEHQVSARSVTIKDRLRQGAAVISIEMPEGKIESQGEKPIGGRPGGTLEVRYKQSGQLRFRVMAMVELAPRNFLILRHDALDANRHVTSPVFSAVVESIRFLSDPLSDDALREALKAGVAWMEGLKQEAVTAALVTEEYLVYEVGGQPIGFVEAYQRKSPLRNGGREHEAIEVFEQSWMFDSPKVARRIQSKMHLSTDFEMEKWQGSVATWVAAEGDRPEQFENAYEEALRDHTALLSGQSFSFSQAVKQNPPFQLPRSYLSRVLIRLLPRLLGDLGRTRTLAFTVFDHERVALVVRVIELKGETTLPGSKTKAFRIDVREGIAAEPSELYVDSKGRILQLRSRALTMRPSNLNELKELFEDRVTAGDRAMARMEQLYRQSEARFIRRR